MRLVAGTMTALRRIVDLALIGLIMLVLFGLALGKVVPLTGHQTIIIGGGSMEPSIGLGSAIVIGSVQPTDLVAGDVVSLQVGPEHATFTHRIVDVIERPDGIWIRTKGDANAAADPTLVPASAILGRVAWAIPYAGYLLALLSLPIGVLFVFGLAATLLAIAWLLESLESDGDRAGEQAPSDVARGEPIPARPLGRPSAHADAIGTSSIVAPAVPHRSGSTARFTAVARPTVPEQLARISEVRALRGRWLAGRVIATHPARRPDGD